MRPEYIIAIILIVALGAGLVILTGTRPSVSDESSRIRADGGVFEQYREIRDPAGFVNTDGITIESLIGKKVVLVDFMTYSCINCQRTFPYMVAWYTKYRRSGLEIVGVHTPEFAFEKDIENVRDAMKRFGITYPVVLDNDYATWRAYGNSYWPRKYLIDIHGNIVYDHIGEGAYEETEMKIQELLAERASVLGENVDMDEDELAASALPKETHGPASPEIYFGALRNEHLENGTRFTVGEQEFSAPDVLEALPNVLYLSGTWNIQDEFAESKGAGKIIFRYRAKNVHMVAGASSPVRVEIIKDGMSMGSVEISGERLYDLILDSDAGEHVLEISIPGSGLRVFTFTFG